MNQIHPGAHIADGVVMGTGNNIGPGVVLGPGVSIGDDNVIHPNAVLYGPLSLGSRNWLGPSCWVGLPGQQTGADHGQGWQQQSGGESVVIGDDNVIREGVTVHAASTGSTSIGSRTYLMTQVHIPHNAIICDDVTIAVGVALGGHTTVQTGSNLGLNSTVHQYRVLGAGVMVGMGSVITRDIPPFATVFGSPARIRGCNRIRMQRMGFTEEEIDAVEAALTGSEARYPDRLQRYVEDFDAAVLARRTENG